MLADSGCPSVQRVLENSNARSFNNPVTIRPRVARRRTCTFILLVLQPVLTIGLSPSFQGLHVLEVMVIMGRMDRAIRIYTKFMGMKTEESRECRDRPEHERMTAAKEATLAL